MSFFVKCLTEVKKEYRTLAFDLIEIDKEIDSRRESLRQFSLERSVDEPVWYPKPFRYSEVTHGLSVTQQAREDFKDLCADSNTILTEAKLKLTVNAKKIAQKHYNDAITRKYELFLDTTLLIFRFVLKAGIIDPSLEAELTDHTNTHHAGWFLLQHLRAVQVGDPTQMKTLTDYLGPMVTYGSLIEDIYMRTHTGATEKATVHTIVGPNTFPALLQPLSSAFFDRHLYGVEDGVLDKQYPLLLAFNGIRQEILELVLETKRNATVRAMKESTEMVDAVSLTEKALAEEIAKHDAAKDGPVENLIATHMDRRDVQWKTIISGVRSEMRALKLSHSKNVPGASSRGAPRKREPQGDGPQGKRRKTTSTPAPPSVTSKEARKKAADKKNTTKQKKDHAAKKRKASPSGPQNPKGRKRDRARRGAPRG